ncbi:hypothetical protein ACSSS7_003406 [Eimeria intestinalis]
MQRSEASRLLWDAAARAPSGVCTPQFLVRGDKCLSRRNQRNPHVTALLRLSRALSFGALPLLVLLLLLLQRATSTSLSPSVFRGLRVCKRKHRFSRRGREKQREEIEVKLLKYRPLTPVLQALTIGPLLGAAAAAVGAAAAAGDDVGNRMRCTCVLATHRQRRRLSSSSGSSNSNSSSSSGNSSNGTAVFTAAAATAAIAAAATTAPATLTTAASTAAAQAPAASTATSATGSSNHRGSIIISPHHHPLKQKAIFKERREKGGKNDGQKRDDEGLDGLEALMARLLRSARLPASPDKDMFVGKRRKGRSSDWGWITTTINQSREDLVNRMRCRTVLQVYALLDPLNSGYIDPEAACACILNIKQESPILAGLLLQVLEDMIPFISSR